MSCHDNDEDDDKINIDDGTTAIGVLRRRSSPVVATMSTSTSGNNHINHLHDDPLLVHSFSESSFSRVMATVLSTATTVTASSSSSINDACPSSLSSSSVLVGDNGNNNNNNNNSDTTNTNHPPPPLSIRGIASSTFVRRRLSRSSSLSWGHKPSPIVGASCLLYLLPVPFLLRACAHRAALSLLLVTLSSYLSDHVYTGLESYAHAVDRALAPLAFVSCLYSTYVDCGLGWAASSLLAVKCHAWANYYSRRGMYREFVLWHCLWHGVGAGLIVLCYWYNDVVGSCWNATTNENPKEVNGYNLMWWLGEGR